MKTVEPIPRKIPVSEFKAHCTEYLRAVENGEPPIQITRHGKVIAKLTPDVSGDKKITMAEWIGGGRGSVVFAPDYDEQEPTWADDEWEMNQENP